jgi:GT2 family glycosyltransferase
MADYGRNLFTGIRLGSRFAVDKHHRLYRETPRARLEVTDANAVTGVSVTRPDAGAASGSPSSTTAVSLATHEPVSARGEAPRVSVVIPTYNSEHYLGSTIESVLDQTFACWELVVFDDGSTDETYEVAREYAAKDDRIRTSRGPNGGVAAARNRGLALTDPRAEMVAFLDHDDLWEPSMLEILVRKLDDHPEYVAAHGLVRCIDPDGALVPGDDLEEICRNRHGFRSGRVVPFQTGEPTTFGALVYHNCVISPGAELIRRDAVLHVGGFDPSTAPADDADLQLRLSRLGDLGFVDRPVLRWRRHPQAQSSTSRRWRAATLRLRAKALRDPTNTPDQMRSATLAHLAAAKASIQQAMDAVHGREWRTALREMFYSLGLYRIYLQARLTTCVQSVIRFLRYNQRSSPTGA